jgi:transcriptional regulator with XRE-family HTH domain
MTNFFKRKKLAPPKRVCLRLKEEREKAGVSLEELAKKTKIDKSHLKALEECRFKDLPEAVVYQKNFVKKYVEVLGVDSAPFLSQYETEEKTRKKTKHPHKVLKTNPLSHLPIFIRYFLIIATALFLMGYLAMQVKNIVEPPELSVYSPADGFVTNNPQINVQGNTDKEVEVSINGKGVGTNEQGQFEELLDLNPGVNTLLISAKKKHGKTTDITRHVVYKIEDN